MSKKKKENLKLKNAGEDERVENQRALSTKRTLLKDEALARRIV